jgi:cytochrome c peroxidase
LTEFGFERNIAFMSCTRSAMFQPYVKSIASASLVTLLAACGGGGGAAGGGGTPAPVGGSPAPAPSPTPAPPAVNQPPVLSGRMVNQRAIQSHEINFDVTQGGTQFSDPEGKPLRYEIKLGHDTNPENDPDPPHGVRVEGVFIRGAPETLDEIAVTITAIDPEGLSVTRGFAFEVSPNGAPKMTTTYGNVVVRVGEQISLDLTPDPATVTEPDGDPLSYQIDLRGFPGLTAQGARLSGHLDSVGAVEVTVTALDPYGTSASTKFVVAAPAAEPGVPTLPATPYAYKDESLPLPFLFKISSEGQVPLWDTQRADNRTSDAGAALGRVLFHDKRLSITNTIACASCHHRENGFASSERFNTGVIGIPLTRNAMALANARYNIGAGWFSDMRARSIREVAHQAMTNTTEMGSALTDVETKVRSTPFYPPLFEAAFGSPEITSDRILRAIEQYVQALISYRSRFDQACVSMDNEPKDCSLVLTAEEMRGKEIFSAAGDAHVPCSLCHELPAAANVWQANNGIDSTTTDPGIVDLGLNRDGRKGKFRPASLRNIALTAPYMHDGRFATLREVIDHYDHGINDSVDLDPLLRNVQGRAIRMNLSEEDKNALEAFLRTLTDEEMLADPKFSDPFQ